MTTTSRNRTIAACLILVAAICAGLAVFYFTQDTTFLASAPARIQIKHGLLFAALAVVALIGANIVWRRRVTA
ncbi:MAG TPA: hypothetical protein VEK76_12665 [Candidatus Binatia bacterium]|nr:hypothetical protein [Candidatus Binatia bacterium]